MRMRHLAVMVSVMLAVPALVLGIDRGNPRGED